jgi:hypothetical protein
MFGVTWETVVTVAVLWAGLAVLAWLFLFSAKVDTAYRHEHGRDETIGRDQYRDEQLARLHLLQKDRAVWDAVHQATPARRSGR